MAAPYLHFPRIAAAPGASLSTLRAPAWHRWSGLAREGHGFVTGKVRSATVGPLLQQGGGVVRHCSGSARGPAASVAMDRIVDVRSFLPILPIMRHW